MYSRLDLKYWKKYLYPGGNGPSFGSCTKFGFFYPCMTNTEVAQKVGYYDGYHCHIEIRATRVLF